MKKYTFDEIIYKKHCFKIFSRNKSAEMTNTMLFSQQTNRIPLEFDNEKKLR